MADNVVFNDGWSDKENSEENGYITSLEVEEMEDGMGDKWIGKITAWYGQFLFLFLNTHTLSAHFFQIMSKLNSGPSIPDLSQMPTNDIIIMFILLICFLNQRKE